MKHTLFCIGFALFSVIFTINPAEAESRLQDGWWRIEAFGAGGVESGAADRNGDVLVHGTVEYEFPLAKRTTLGLRILPVFVYAQGDDSKEFLGIEYYKSNDDNVMGAGGGLALRFYSVKDEYRGFFGEIDAQILVHENQFEGNSSNFNFMTGAGVGYKFANDLSLVVKIDHISNAGFGEHNRGVNTVGLGVGFDFKVRK